MYGCLQADWLRTVIVGNVTAIDENYSSHGWPRVVTEYLFEFRLGSYDIYPLMTQMIDRWCPQADGGM